MVAVRHKNGLSEAELEQIERTLATGRRPKVVFTEAAGQIANQTGQVVSVTPAAGGEPVSLLVRFGKDELAFTTADLALPARPSGRGAAPQPRPAPAVNGATVAPAAEAAAEPPAAAAGTPPPAAAPTTATGATTAAVTEPVPAKRGAARRTAKAGKAPAGLTVTVSYGSGEWSVAAHQGSRILVKATPVRASDAIHAVQTLGVPGVAEAVAEVVEAAREDAAREAERLRDQLAAVEARLADLGG